MRRTGVSGSLLAVLLVLAVPAMAQDPPHSANAKTELAELRVSLRSEAIARVVRSIAAKVGKTDPAKASLIAAKVADHAFVEKHLDAELEKTLEDLFAKELKTGKLEVADLKVDLQLYRRYRNGYTVREVDAKRVPANRSGFNPPRSTGYLPEVAAIDASAEHSMHDLVDYVDDRLTTAALERMAKSGVVVEVHVGGELEALTDLKNRGWNVFGEVRSPNGTYERLFLAESPTGEIRYIVSGDVEGMDRVRHLSALLRFAGDKGVASDKVELVGDPAAVEARRFAELREALARLPLGGETALIGFRQGMKTELLKRALARRGIERVREVLGSKPYTKLVETLEKERDKARGAERAALEGAIDTIKNDRTVGRALGLDPKEIFGSTKNTEDVVKAEKVLVALARSLPDSKVLGELVRGERLRLPGGGLADAHEIARDLEAGTLRADEILAKTPEGVKSVLLVNNYYGDAMGTVVRALLESGRRRIAYFGTAGGVAADVKVGDIHVPGTFFDQAGGAVNAKNMFVDFLKGRTTSLGSRLLLETRIGNVYSPLEETMNWLNGARHGGLDAVEVETSYIAKELEKYNASVSAAKRARLYGSVIISDVPGTEVTLGNNFGKTQATFAKMLDVYLEALGIEDLVLKEKTTGPKNRPVLDDPKMRRALEVAEKLVPRELPRSTNLRDRIAGILNGLKADLLDALDISKKLKPADIPGLDEAMRKLLESEVESSYTDAAATASLEKANAIVSRVAMELQAKHPRADFELRVAGGIEGGSYSPARGLVLEVKGSAEVQKSATAILSSVLADVKDAPTVRLGDAGPNALSLGKGEVFRAEPEPLVRFNALRALARRGAIVREASVEYAGSEHAIGSAAEIVARRTGMTPAEAAKALAVRGGTTGTTSSGVPIRGVERRSGVIDALVERGVGRPAERARGR